MAIINRLFNLRPGDFSRALPFFGYYFLIIASYSTAQTVRDALFLNAFTANQLPYVDIASAALVSVIVAIYIKAGKRADLRNLLVGSLMFYAANIMAMWRGIQHYKLPWAIPALYIWVGIFGVLATAQVWTLANFVWTTREAKRLFGLLAGGGTAGNIFAGFFAKWVISKFGTESLLLVIMGYLLLAVPLVVIIWSQRQIGETDAGPPEQNAGNLRESFKLVRQSPHLQAIAALICLSSIVTTAAGWQLKAIAKEVLVQKDAVGAFLATFAGYTGIGSFIAQVLIAGKLMRRFGIGVALLVLPLCLLGGSVAVVAWGTLWAATLLKGSDKVVRYSVDVSALQLLYLPVPSNIKLQVKSFIDTVIWRFGDGLAGLTVLLFCTNLHFTARQLSWVTISLLGAWIFAAFIARHEYVATLKENIQRVRIRAEQVVVPELDEFTTMVFAEKLRSGDPNEIMYALDLIEMGQRPRSHSAILNLLEHPSPHIRKKAIAVLDASSEAKSRHQIAALLQDENLDVRTEALRFLTRHDEMDPLTYIDKLGDFADFSIRSAAISFLARPGESQNIETAALILDGMVRESGDQGRQARIEAGRLLASLPDRFEVQLEALLDDGDPDALREAVRAAGMLRKQRFIPRLIQLLPEANVGADAADALALFGDSVVPALREMLTRDDDPLEIRREIPEVLRRIGTAAAASALADNLLQGDTELRFRIISALNKLCELRRNLSLDKDLIETVMLAEIMGHYRSYQILGTKNGDPDETSQKTLNAELERIFRLMKLLFPSIDLQNAYLGIQSTDPVMHANALEFLDNALNPRLRSKLVPLIDSEVSLEERVRLANRFLGFTVQA